MANTYTQIHLQLIFGVKYREEEYQKFLQLFEVNFDERYIFKQPISIFEDKLSGR